jgi:predicted Zn-dependent protease with MMP-like domain
MPDSGPKGQPTEHDDSEDDDAPIDAEQALLEALDALYELADEDPDEALELFRSFPDELQQNREFRIARAAIEKSAGELETAVKTLEALLKEDEHDADIHHMLGDALEDAGDESRATAHFLRTWELDSAELVKVEAELSDAMVKAASDTILSLPEEFRSRLKSVPIVLEDRPTRREVQEGLDPRSLGVFEGTPLGDGDDEPLPPRRIVLYSANLAAEFGDEDLLDQVAVTILHELGHYFGLEEEDLERLGLG